MTTNYPVFTWDTYVAGRDGVSFGASGATTDPRRAVRDLSSALRNTAPGTNGVIFKATPAPFATARYEYSGLVARAHHDARSGCVTWSKHAAVKQNPKPDQEPDSTARLVGRVTDAGWRRVGEVGGVPRWQWQEDHMIHIVTYDHDVLRIIGAALNYHDTAGPAVSHAFITAHLLGGRSGTPCDGPLGIINTSRVEG